MQDLFGKSQNRKEALRFLNVKSFFLPTLVLETSGTLYANALFPEVEEEKKSARDIGEGRRRRFGYFSESWWTGAAPTQG